MWKEEATPESIDNGRMNSAEKIVLSNPINVLKAIDCQPFPYKPRYSSTYRYYY
jgi:hypothetical protein